MVSAFILSLSLHDIGFHLQDSYLAKAQLQELRNELSGLRQNDSQNLKEDSQAILREIEFLDQRFSDSLLQLKSDISMDLNMHKGESKELTTDVDLRIQEVVLLALILDPS
jgi:hypothetical protein